MDEDRILEEIRRDPDVDTGLHELMQLKDLQEHPGWQYQAERFKGYKKGVSEALASRILHGLKLNAEEIAFNRGYAQAVEDIFKFPERVEKNFHRAAEKAWERLQEEGAVSDEIPDT